jgi:hypothetical protein
MDIMRFLRAHWTLIQENPFDVYHYVGFTPLSSIFQQIYAHSASFPYSVNLINSELDWPFESVVQPHTIEIQSLSPCGNWLATGGSSNNRAIFGVWDVRTADGTTTTHPCKRARCSTYYMAFHQRKDTLELRTRCRCENLCVWHIGIDSIVLLRQVRLKWEGTLRWWADDFSKAMSDGLYRSDNSCQLSGFLDGEEIYQHHLISIREKHDWRFSPGTGEKVVGWSSRTLRVFESSSGRHCFTKSLQFTGFISFKSSDYFRCVHFSPNAKLLFYSFRDSLGGALSSGYSAVLVSSDNGFQLWRQSIDWIHHVEFFPEGDRILVGTSESVHIFSSLDGCIKQSCLLAPSNMSISPDNDKIAIMTSRDVEMLDSATLDRTQYYSWTSQSYTKFIYISWKWLTVVKIDHSAQSVTFLNLLSPKSKKTDAPFETKSNISRIFTSPDESRLLTIDENGLIQLWCTTSGTRVSLTGDNIGKVESDSHIESTADSSIIMIWAGYRGKLAVVDTKTGCAKAIDLPPYQIMAATFCPFSKRIFIINRRHEANFIFLEDIFIINRRHEANFIFLEDVTSHSLGKVPKTLSVSEILVSPATNSIVLLGKRHGNDVVSIFDSVTHPVYRHFNFSRSHWTDWTNMKAKLTPDGTHIFMIGTLRGEEYTVSLINISVRPLQRLTIASFGLGLQRGGISLETTTIGNLNAFRTTLELSDLGSIPVMDAFFNFSDGRMVVSPKICWAGGIYYGKHRLPMAQSSVTGYRLYVSSERKIASLNENGQVIVVDYSRYIDRM